MEGHRLRMLGNRLLRKTFRTMREEETGGLRKSHKEYHHDFYFLPNRILFECLNEEK
jgi:hypothetical protein